MFEEKKFRKTHPYSILRHLKISILLILLSMLQQILFHPQNILEIIGSLGINAFYVMAILFYYLSTYGNLKYYVDERSIYIREGVFIHRMYRIPKKKICTIVFYRDIISSLFGAEKISIDTPSGSYKKFDMESYFSRRNARKIREKLCEQETGQTFHRSRTAGILMMSAFWSNPVTGLIFIIPVINGVGKLLGKEAANEMVRQSIHSQWFYYARFISPAVATLTAIILLSWSISMLLCFLRYVRLCTYRLQEYLVIVRGLISHHMTYIRLNSLSSVNIDQSLLMRLLRVKSCSVSAVGSGKLKGDRGMIIAADKTDKVHRTMTELTGMDYHADKILRVAKKSVFAYIYLPLLGLTLPTALFFLRYLLPKLWATITFMAYLVLLVVIWWLLFRIFCYKESHIGYNAQSLIVCCFHRLVLKKYYIPVDNIQKIEISQSFFQKRSGKCNVKVYLYFEKRAVCRIKQLPLPQLLRLLALSPLTEKREK